MAAAIRRDGKPADFSRQTVIDAARALSMRAFEPPDAVPEALQQLDYDTYRQLRYRKSEAIWGGAKTRFNMELFAPGFLFTRPVRVSIVENGVAHELRLTRESFELPSQDLLGPLLAIGRFAGFRLHYPLNTDDYHDEFVVFQGASYFRGVAAGQIYGLSARGLAIDVAEPNGEEHPVFRRFWVERPASTQDNIVVHALLDSPGVAGAYRFGIFPGAETRMDVELSLFPRRELSHVGIAPLTSMFMHNAVRRAGVDDFRPAVHDSQALVMHSGNGERIWRGLANPAKLQVSAFADDNPKGFGLAQRDRRFARFEDLEARYEQRPSAWVQPLDDWGKGQVQLLEIPSDSETNDNIVAYWRPKESLTAGTQFHRRYRLSWADDSPATPKIARVVQSLSGKFPRSNQRELVMDYTAPGDLDVGAIAVDATASAGKINEAIVVGNPHVDGFRVVVKFTAPDTGIAELRVQPKVDGRQAGETWLYRYTGAG